MASLPIDPLLPQLRQALSGHAAVILQAPPGAGKTTRVPLALLDAAWLEGRSILMLEPRRLAATNAARYMAGQIGEAVGERVGYTIRDQRQVSARTRVEVVTEGILSRRLHNDPELMGVGLVIFDEFHERNLNSDLALALCRDSQLGLRDDLKLLVMSATLDGAPLAELLQAPLLTSEGRSYPVTINFRPPVDERRIVDNCAAAIKHALRETSGDLLVFLPGAGEIRRCEQLLQGLPEVDIRPLYGELDFTRQEQAILPGPRRKVVLATNIAETSLTIEGISVVIDSGYARQPRFDPGRGTTRLTTARISAASATQRSGRAGRIKPGVCYRLWSEAVQGSLLPFTPPEIRSADLAGLALELASWGVQAVEQLCWLDPPPPGQLQAGYQLLQLLGALDERRQLTPLGRRLAKLPAHPRLGRLLLVGEQTGCLALACDLVALLSERDPWRGREPQATSASDLLDRLEQLWREPSTDRAGTFAAIQRSSRYWRKQFRLSTAPLQVGPETHQQINQLLLGGFPDRIARQRQPGSRDYQLSSGKGARLSGKSAVSATEYLLAAELHQRRGETEIIQASSIERSELSALIGQLPWQRTVAWDAAAGRVVASERQQLGAIVLAERPARVRPDERSAALLEGIRKEGLQLLNWTPQVETLRNRLALLRKHDPGGDWPDVSDSQLLATLEDWLQPFLGQAKSRVDLQKLDLRQALLARLSWPQQQRLDQLAPLRLTVPSGSQIRLDYPAQGVPVLAVKLQELFGLAETPRIAGGQVAVQLHLLSPAGRPLQVTQDLVHFWNQVYPEVKKEMKGRYPKHPWPDDPWSAVATRHTSKRSR